MWWNFLKSAFTPFLLPVSFKALASSVSVWPTQYNMIVGYKNLEPCTTGARWWKSYDPVFIGFGSVPKKFVSRGPIYKESYDVSYDSRKIVTNLS